jgi:tRNA (guanine26-N2/guanine27-N2)-dimethyltransferase
MKEAGVEFLLPEKLSGVDEGLKVGKSMSVFYNPRMTINRDLTICMINAYGKNRSTKLLYCDSMAATGIRALRLLKQCEAIEKVYINDLNPIAVETIKENIKLHSIPSSKYSIFSQDAKSLLSHFHEENERFFDVIDIDPFGSPSHYIPAAMQSISISEVGGLLCVTATDTPVLFGIKKEACIRKYLTEPFRTEFIKEMGTRILIYYVAKIAHLYELYIEPILSISAHHFVRVFFHIRKGVLGANANIQQFGYYVYCNSCFYRSAVNIDVKGHTMHDKICPHCGNPMIKSGLLWMGNLHKSGYLKDLETQFTDPLVQSFPAYNQMRKFVELAKDEDEYPPYFFSIPKIADSLDLSYPSLSRIRARLEEMGFKASRTHFEPQGLKTTASVEVLKEILKECHH